MDMKFTFLKFFFSGLFGWVQGRQFLTQTGTQENQTTLSKLENMVQNYYTIDVSIL